MHPADIQAALKKSGASQAQIARRLRLTHATVSKVVHGQGESRRVKQAIARVIGKPVSEIWP